MINTQLDDVLLGEPNSVRTVAQLEGYWAASVDEQDARVVYRTYGPPAHDTEHPELKWAVTVIEPGEVQGEAFMTRGHFHLNPERGEWMMGLRGTGKLVLRSREGDAWAEEVGPGRIHMIPGNLAHRVVNDGHEPLIFVVTWISDCGHDYEAIERDGFGTVIYRSDADSVTSLEHPGPT